jgi:hypothetical protein
MVMIEVNLSILVLKLTNYYLRLSLSVFMIIILHLTVIMIP